MKKTICLDAELKFAFEWGDQGVKNVKKKSCIIVIYEWCPLEYLS